MPNINDDNNQSIGPFYAKPWSEFAHDISTTNKDIIIVLEKRKCLFFRNLNNIAKVLSN